MALGVSIAVMVLGLVGIVVAMFLTDREMKARYGYGGQKALAQGERDGTVPQGFRLMVRLSAAILAIATFAFVTTLLG